MKCCKIVFTILLVLNIFDVFSQPIDLINQLYSTKSKLKKVEILETICSKYASLESDSLLKFTNLGIYLSDKNTLTYWKFKYYRTIYLDDNSMYQVGELLTDSIINYCKNKPGYEWVLAKSYSMKSGFLFHKGAVKEALDQDYQGAKIAESTSDTQLIMDMYLSIGYTFMETSKYKEAINWFEKGISLIKTEERRNKTSNLFLNTASCYNNVGEYNRALELANLGIKNARNLEKWSSIANGLMIRSDIYINTKQFNLAEKDLDEAIIIRKKSTDTLLIASDMAQYAFFLASVGKANKGIEIANNALKLIDKFNVLDKELYIYKSLASNYKVAKDYKNLSIVQQRIIELSDSLHIKEFMASAGEAQTKYEVEKKELTIENQQLGLKVRRLYIIVLVGLIIILIPLSVFWVIKLRNRYRKSFKKEIESERQRISNDLHDGVGAYASSIFNGIRGLEIETQSPKLENLKTISHELIEKLNQTVWVLDKETISISDLYDKYKNWFLKIIPNFEGIDYEFNEEILDNSILKPQDSLDYLNMLQEMTNNSLKHSKCSKIICTIINKNNSISIQYFDNGIGFEKDAIVQGNGLLNLNKRAKKLQGKLDIISNNGGTTIYFKAIL